MSAFVTPVTVRFRDIDAMGHVNNAVYFTYFEEGRKSLFSSFDPEGKPVFDFILASIRCDYLRPVSLESRLVVRIRVTEIGKKSFVFGYQLTDLDDETSVFANAESVQVCYDYREERSIEVPDDLRRNLTTLM